MANANLIATTYASASGTGVTLNVPSGGGSGNLLLAVVFQDNDGAFASSTAPSGWTEVSSSVAVSTASGFGKIFTKTASGSEPANYVFPADAASANHAWMHRIDNYSTTSVFAASAVWSRPSPASTTSLVAPSVTLAGAGLLISGWMVEGVTTGATITPPGGMSGSSNLDTSVFVVSGYGSQSQASGSSGTRTGTSNQAGSTATLGYLSYSLAISNSTIGSVTGTSTASATVTAARTDSGSVTGASTASATVTATQTRFGSVTGTSTASATVTAVRSEVGSVTGTVTASAVVTAEMTPPLEASVTGVATASAEIRAVTGFYFRTPSVREHPYVRHGLWSRTYIDRGVTVLKFGSSYQQWTDPDPTLITEADVVYIGGHLYFVTPDEAAALTAAGYGVWVTDDPGDPIPDVDYSAYGTGFYGTGPYGD